MRTKPAAALVVGDQIIHDGTARLGKPIVIRTIANDQVRANNGHSTRGYRDEAVGEMLDRPMLSLNNSHVIVNDSMTFHKSWEVTVK